MKLERTSKIRLSAVEEAPTRLIEKDKAEFNAHSGKEELCWSGRVLYRVLGKQEVQGFQVFQRFERLNIRRRSVSNGAETISWHSGPSLLECVHSELRALAGW